MARKSPARKAAGKRPARKSRRQELEEAPTERIPLRCTSSPGPLTLGLESLKEIAVALERIARFMESAGGEYGRILSAGSRTIQCGTTFCNATGGPTICTLAKGHPGLHVGNGSTVDPGLRTACAPVRNGVSGATFTPKAPAPPRCHGCHLLRNDPKLDTFFCGVEPSVASMTKRGPCPGRRSAGGITLACTLTARHAGPCVWSAEYVRPKD